MQHKFPISGYPAYHTGYETFYLVEKIIDPDFALHQGCSRLLGVLIHALSGRTILPYKFEELAQHIKSDYDSIWKNDDLRIISKSELTYGENSATIQFLENAMSNFLKAAKEWDESIQKVDANNPLQVRQINDLMMGVERAFIKPEGLYERPEIKHVLYAPFKYDKYSRAAFPGLLDLMYKIAYTRRTDAAKVPKYWKMLQKHISDIAIIIRGASKILTTDPL